jgi:REP element-mobilizing transposase RayT
MPNTYSQIYLQIVFAVQGRQNIIRPDIEERINKYITGTIKKKNHKLLIINGMPDHIHIFVGFDPNDRISDFVKEIKRCSTNFINGNQLVHGHFSWQKGFGVFSYSRSQIGTVCKYIEQQEEHHRIRTFREEYEEMLKRFNVEYNKEYILKGYEEME